MADLDDDAALRREIEALKLELVRFVLLEARERSEKGEVAPLSPAVQAALTRGAETAMSAQIGQSAAEHKAAMAKLREDARSVSLLLSGVKDQIASQTAAGTTQVNDAMAQLKVVAAGITSALVGIAGSVGKAERFGTEADRKMAELTEAIDQRTQQSKKGFADVNVLIGAALRSASKINAAANSTLMRLEAANLNSLPGSEVNGNHGQGGKNNFTTTRASAQVPSGTQAVSMDTNGAQLNNWTPRLNAVQALTTANAGTISAMVVAPYTSQASYSFVDSTGQGRRTTSYNGATQPPWMKRTLCQKLRVFIPDVRSLGWLVAMVLAGVLLWQNLPKDKAQPAATTLKPVVTSELAAQLSKPVGAIPGHLQVTLDDIATGYPAKELTDEPGKTAKADARQRLPERLANLRGQISIAVNLRGKICAAKQQPLPSDEKGILTDFDKILPLLAAIQGKRGPMTPEERASVGKTLDRVNSYREKLKSNGASC